MSSSFHLAIPAGDLEKAEAFYTKILGCKTGNREKGKWVDVDFWGNELTLHQTSMKLPRERHDVDMGDVPVPHFGVHLKKEVFDKIKANIVGQLCENNDWFAKERLIQKSNIKDNTNWKGTVFYNYLKNTPLKYDGLWSTKCNNNNCLWQLF